MRAGTACALLRAPGWAKFRPHVSILATMGGVQPPVALFRAAPRRGLCPDFAVLSPAKGRAPLLGFREAVAPVPGAQTNLKGPR